MRPDRVVIGADSEHARAVLRALYRPLYLIETPMVFTDIETAELIKYAANAFLATKITFINEIADLCEKVGADVQEVAKGIGLDGRIGRKFLHAGPGFGGSVFSEGLPGVGADRARRRSRRCRSSRPWYWSTTPANRVWPTRLSPPAAEASPAKRLAVLGLTFKPNTDDMRDSPSLSILPRLIAAGATIRAFDPEGIDEAKKLLPDLVYCADAYETMEGADALVLLTEWNAFRASTSIASKACSPPRSLSTCATSISRKKWSLPGCPMSALAAPPHNTPTAIARICLIPIARPTPTQKASPMSSVVAKRVLVTGGAGFLGSHLCERLIAQRQ